MVELNDLPDEWENQKGFDKLLMEAQDLHDSAFVNNSKEFSFIGFQHPGDMNKMNLILTKIRGFINKHLPKGYVFEDRIISHNQLEGFEYKDKGN